MENKMLYVDDVMHILGIDNDWVARCVLAKMDLDFSDFTEEQFITECHKAADKFVEECANAEQGS
jgi:hypothetical protein